MPQVENNSGRYTSGELLLTIHHRECSGVSNQILATKQMLGMAAKTQFFKVKKLVKVQRAQCACGEWSLRLEKLIWHKTPVFCSFVLAGLN